MDSDRLLTTFLEMTRIGSPSRFEAKMAEYAKKQLEDMGFTVSVDDSGESTGSDTGNVIAKLAGTAQGKIMLCAHMDCVEPCIGVEPLVEEGIIRSAGKTVLGGDDKAGIAAIFEAVRSVIESGEPRPDITVLLNTCEELSLLGASALSDSLFADNPPCIVFDASGEPGTIITDSPEHNSLTARFTGRASHAGIEPEKGISAIQMAAVAISAMELGRLDEASTANIGIIEGGHEINIIADSCVIRGECRSFHENRVEEIRDQITQACENAAKQFGGKVEVTWRRDYPGIHYEEHDELVQALKKAAREVGLYPKINSTGGGADANVLKGKGARAITVAVGMENVHSSDEFITVENLENSTLFCEAVIRQFVV